MRSYFLLYLLGHSLHAAEHGCSLKKGIYFHPPRTKHSVNESETDCAKACLAVDSCVGFTYYAFGLLPAACYHKKGENQTAIAGKSINSNAALGWCPKGPITYSVKEKGTVSSDDCAEICKASGICKSFTYNNHTEDCAIFVKPDQDCEAGAKYRINGTCSVTCGKGVRTDTRVTEVKTPARGAGVQCEKNVTGPAECDTGVLCPVSRVMDVKIGKDSSWGALDLQVGQDADLSCTSSKPITACVFINPSGDIMSKIKDVNYQDGRVTFDDKTQKTECKIKISDIERKDNGLWKCTITITEKGTAEFGTNTVTLNVDSRSRGDQETQDSGIGPPVYAAIGGGCFVVVCALAALACYCRKRSLREPEETQAREVWTLPGKRDSTYDETYQYENIM